MAARSRVAGRFRLEPFEPQANDWEMLDNLPDRVLFQTKEWLGFLAETQGASPVVAAVTNGGESVGYFTGLTVSRGGLRILGSPFPGWTTPYMGFNLRQGASRSDAAMALPDLAFQTLGCVHVELKDRHLTTEEAAAANLETQLQPAFEVDLHPTEEQVLASFSKSCRWCIRRAESLGVSIEEATDEGFADDYYSQLKDVFAKRALVPTYGVERVRSLIRHVHPTGRLLLLRARSPEGECIATGIFPAFNGRMYYWGGASFRSHQILRPNEALFWHALLFWKRRGALACDMGGGGTYKQKYRPRQFVVPLLRKPRWPGLLLMRRVAQNAFTWRQKVRGRIG